MSETDPTSSNLAAISMVDVLRGVGRRKVLILSITLASFLAALAVVLKADPTYSTEAQVLIENMTTPFDQVQTSQTQGGAASGGGVDDRVVSSQMVVLKSEDLGRRVVAALKLDEQPEFNPLIDGIGAIGRLKIQLGFSEDPALKTPEQRALDHYSDQLSIYQQQQSNVISIKYTSNSPRTAADVANTLAQVYVLATRESQSQPTERARDWLAQQITELRTKLAAAERAVEEFRSQAGLLQSATTTLNTQQISDLNSQITVAQAASAEAKARAQAIRQQLEKNGSVDSSAEVLASTVIQKLKEQRTTAVQELAQLNAVYLPSHPKLIAAKRALADIDAQMKAEALKIVAGLDEQARVMAAREQSLRDSLESLKSRESASNLDDVKLKALERDAAADRALLETMLARYAEASSRQDVASQPGFARIIETASVPASPSFPKRGPTVLLATLAGLALGFGITFILEIMRAAGALTQRIEQASAGQQPPARPDLVMTPFAPPPASGELKPRPAIQTVRPAAVSAESIKASSPVARIMPPLATFMRAGSADRGALLEQAEYAAATAAAAGWVTNCQRDLGVRRIGIAAMAAGGDSGVAGVGIARAVAAGGKRVVLVDAARQTSAIESLCGVAPGPGLVDMLSGAADFTKVFGRDSRSAVHVLRYGSDRSEAAHATAVQRIDQILSGLGALYDIIFVDAGDTHGRGIEILCKCEAAILLAPVDHLKDAVEAAQALEAHGLKAGRYALVA